ncbi:hypothetical protein Baya_9703 [Bagarius yarrelli]|uniref:Uncharacterized protein n=1 Tax=Bagarius yarrelli TaxID=175774 RepID=A0A556UFK1_BAGYA|nr:hypothetical protein Baya_9703 [Bagarius yarrelli]
MSAKRSQSNTDYSSERTTGDKRGMKPQATSKNRAEKTASPAKPKEKADKVASHAKPKLKINKVSHSQSSPFPDSGKDVAVPPPDFVDEVIAPPPDFADDSDTPLSVFMDDVITTLPAVLIVPPPVEFADDVIVLPPNQSAMVTDSSDPRPEKAADNAAKLIP